MSRKRIRIRQRVLPSLPYWRSILASFVLVLSMMFLFQVLADPRSGKLGSPEVVAPMFVLFVIVDAGVFYAEFRLQKRRPPAAARTHRRVAIEGEEARAD